MSLTTHNDSNDAPETVSVSVKGILAPVSQALKDVSRARDVNQSVVVREMVNGPLSSLIHVYFLKSQLVASLDQEIARHVGGPVQPVWQTGPLHSTIDAVYRHLLGINTEDDLTRILMHHARHLNARANQLLLPGSPVAAGASLYFALFCEVAVRDDETIEAFWTSVARYWGTWYQRQHYYQQINQLRSLSGLPPASTLSKASWVGEYARVDIVREEGTQSGISQILMTLLPACTRHITPETSHFAIPTCAGHYLVPDASYGVPYVTADGQVYLGFSFRERICSMHCYTLPDGQVSPVLTLTEVANTLADRLDICLFPKP